MALLKRNFGEGHSGLSGFAKDGESLYDILEALIKSVNELNDKFNAHDHGGAESAPAGSEQASIETLEIE